MPGFFSSPLEFGMSVQPRWAGASPWIQAACWTAAAIPLILTVWLYRSEFRLVRPGVARLLLTLRLAAVAGLLGVALFQPVVRTTRTEPVRGTLLIARDCSESQSVADPQRSPIDKLRLARALGLANDLADNRQIDNWINELVAKGQIAWPVGSNGTDAGPRQAFDRTCQRIDALTRFQIGSAILGSNVRLLESIESTHEVRVFDFTAVATPGPRVPAESAVPNGTASNLVAPLESALGRGSDAPAAIVLFTDGQHTGNESPVAKAAELGVAGIPVFPVVLGPREPPPDVAIREYTAPATAFKNSEVAIDAKIQVNNLGPRQLQVELQRPGRQPIVSTIAHDGGSRLHAVRFPVRFAEPGLAAAVIQVRAEPEEVRTDNNSRSLSIQVSDEKARVLVIDGEARWEFHYLASALARDRGAEVSTILFSQPRLSESDDGGQAHLPARLLPQGPQSLDRFDCIVLGDVSPEQLGTPDRERLEKWVSDRGGTLVIVAGKKAMPGAFFRAGLENDPIRKLLPITSVRAMSPISGFSVALTEAGRLENFLRLESSAEDNDRRWKSFPKHYWGIAGKAKPGAAVLGCDRESTVNSPAITGEWERDNALIARHAVGFGRVLYVGVESTWRLRLRAGDTYHHRLWGQILRWAAADQALIAGNATVRFGPRRPIVQHGEDVEIAVRWLDDARPLTTGALAAIRIWKTTNGQADEPVSLVPISPSETRKREWEARIRPLPPGEYAAELVVPDRKAELLTLDPEGKPSPLRARFRVDPRESREMADLSSNVPLLEEIAAKSGGRVFTAENVSELPAMLATRTASRAVASEWKLGESWPTLMILLLLLGGEWAVRKLSGLP